ncbi:right-handed parallel beta-helix repeat-containing protein [Methanobrevibacter sp.]|uniref:NosD domain-containing protein n=1 Tax=Methanobrevibacter sp. TaxID=66852 RepID=UPI0026DF362A|nr:right-handed parallel beta-helix repeat-containing protein [Methanobrevibacter sp.]MDO5860657.1 right-handed parallel beta-helix repeat-containing protein [Methanobrevibacter sp.]
MNKKSLILAILLVLIVSLGASTVSAENSTDITSASETTDIISDVNTTPQEVTIETTDTNDQIQAKINGLNDGDILNFQQGEYKDICIYVNKSITINGNGATLYGYDRPSLNTTPDIILNTTAQGGYAITNLATLYILETDGLTMKDLNFVAGANSGTSMGKDARYSNCVIYNYRSNNAQISNITVDGCSWGIWLQNCADTIIENNNVRNQMITGIFSFQSPRSIIRNNTVTNAKNHGIDVRHQSGPNATVINNKVIGSEEGIYLLHSKGHTVTGNTILNCSLSSITCCGAGNINIENNTFYNSRIGVLLGGGAPQGGVYTAYSNITIGENDWKLDTLPFPPSFVFYVAEAKGDYASVSSMMGTHTDSSVSEITYVEYTGIETPADVVVDYGTMLKPTGNTTTITSGMTNDEIQATIDGMANGDTLIFEENAVFENVTLCIVNKNIKIIGNNATLIGRESASKDLIPERIINATNAGGFGIQYSAVIYSVNNTGTVISDLNIVGKYPAYDASNINQYSEEYCTAGIYAYISKNIAVTGCNINGASWGMFIGERQNGCPNAILTNNKISNQYTTGILCFGSKQSIIANNTITNAKNHGIDVRFGAGFGATVFNNTISGAKEGIYLLHSYGHKVYNNTILNSKISSITCYGSGNEYLFNNTLSGSRIAILLAGGYYNVTIGPNSYTPDKLPFPPTFEYYLIKAENKYINNVKNVMRTYSDKEVVTIEAPDVTTTYKSGVLTIKLIDQNNVVMTGKTLAVSINTTNHTVTTDENGTATIALDLPAGDYIANISFTGNDNYANAKASAKITVNKVTSTITAAGKTVYLKTIASGYKYSVTLKDAKGNTLDKKTITIVFNGKTYKATTNSKGVATVTLKSTATGSKKATIKFAGDDEYKAVTKTVTIKVTKEASKLTASNKAYKVNLKIKAYKVVLKSKSGKVIAKAKVTIKVNGKTYSATTNAKGVATLKITKLTKKGSFTSLVKFAGNKYYNAISKKVKIIAK